MTDFVIEKLGSGVNANARRITFGDHAAIAHHDHRLGSAKRRFGPLLEGMIECSLQRGIGRLDDLGAGDVGEKRWRLRCLQRLKVGPGQIRLPPALHAHAAKAFVERDMRREQADNRYVNRPGGAIEPVTQTPSQQADAGTRQDFGEACLRIEPGDKGLGAEGVGDGAGSNADRPLGMIDRNQRHGCGHGQRARDHQQPSPIHGCLRALSRWRDF